MRIVGDVTGGLTAGIVALPLCLAFGIASGLGASAGLWGAIALCFFASIFGGTKTQISGPTGPMTVVVATIVLAFDGNIGLVAAIFILTGILQMLFGFLKIGDFVKFIPYPVVSGFMSGVGVIIILLQIAPMLGYNSTGSITKDLLKIPFMLKDIHINTVLITFFGLAILYLTPKKIATLLPTPLISLIAITAIVVLFDIDVAKIGAMPTSLPSFIIPNLESDHLIKIATYAFVLAALGSIDSLLTSVVADSITNTKHNSNKELIGQGLGNMAAGFIGGLVGAGATMRTVINIKTGGNSRLSGVISALFLLIVFLFIGSLVAQIPIAALSAILIKVGFDIIDYRLLKNYKAVPKSELVVAGVVFFLTVFVDLIVAVAIGSILSALFSLWAIVVESRDLQVVKYEKFNLISIKNSFFFANLSSTMQKIESHLDEPLVIDLRDVKFIDLSATYGLKDLFITQQNKNLPLYFIFNKEQLEKKNIKNITRFIGKNHIFTSMPELYDSINEK